MGSGQNQMSAVRGRVQRVRRTRHGMGRNSLREVIRVGANVTEVVRWPRTFFKVPSFDGSVNFRLVLIVRVCFRGRGGGVDPRNDDHSNDSKNRDDL